MKKILLLNLTLNSSTSTTMIQPVPIMATTSYTPIVITQKSGWPWFLENIFYPIVALIIMGMLGTLIDNQKYKGTTYISRSGADPSRY